jgi:hypothetical protein
VRLRLRLEGGPANRFLVASCLFLVTITWSVEAIGGQLNLTWVDTSTDELGFSVERSVGITGAFAVLAMTGPGVTTYTDATVADSTTYCYRVRAFNAAAYSGYSNPACATTAPAALALALSVNQQTFALANRFQADVTVINGAPSAVADVYFGSLLPSAAGPALGCPGGDAVAYLVDALAGLGGLVVRCLSEGLSSAVPLYHAVSVPVLSVADFFGFGFNWPLTTPGDYTFFMALTQAGTTNVIALGTATVSYAP